MSILVIIAICFFVAALYLLVTGSIVGAIVAALIGVVILFVRGGNLKL